SSRGSRSRLRRHLFACCRNLALLGFVAIKLLEIAAHVRKPRNRLIEAAGAIEIALSQHQIVRLHRSRGSARVSPLLEFLLSAIQVAVGLLLVFPWPRPQPEPLG